MASFFLSIVNISFVAAVVALAVVLLRFLLKKAPRWITCLLWALVGLRLVFPFLPESRFSLIPSTDVFTVQSSAGTPDAIRVHTGVSVINNGVNGQLASSAQASEQVLGALDILAIVWALVASAVLLYGIISYLLLYLRVRTAIPLKDNVYQSENVKSPFVLGFVSPKIYIPFSLKGRTLKYVLSHEEAHLKRKDHIVKPFAFLLLSIHWFNPFMWLSYVLLCRDIEVACDEKVIKNYSVNKRKNYAFALLECKVNRSNIAVCPVAFGEVNVATRIKKTLCYKKPALWLVGVAVTLSLLAACALLTNPKAESISDSTTLNAHSSVSATEPSAEITATEPATKTTEANKATQPTPVTDTEETEGYSFSETNSEYYADDNEYYADDIEPELRTLPSPFEAFAAQQEAEIMQRRYETLKKDTRNHSDECQCRSCDELREAGIYPRETKPAPTLTVILPVDNSDQHENPDYAGLSPFDASEFISQVSEAYTEATEGYY